MGLNELGNVLITLKVLHGKLKKGFLQKKLETEERVLAKKVTMWQNPGQESARS